MGTLQGDCGAGRGLRPCGLRPSGALRASDRPAAPAGAWYVGRGRIARVEQHLPSDTRRHRSPGLPRDMEQGRRCASRRHNAVDRGVNPEPEAADVSGMVQGTGGTGECGGSRADIEAFDGTSGRPVPRFRLCRGRLNSDGRNARRRHGQAWLRPPQRPGPTSIPPETLASLAGDLRRTGDGLQLRRPVAGLARALRHAEAR